MTERYDRLYRGNPHGSALTWLAVETGNDRVVALTSLFPRRLVVDGQLRMGSIGGDSFVEPSARRQGLASRLHAVSTREMPETAVDFHFGAPLPENRRALVRGGGTEVTPFLSFVRPLSSGYLADHLSERIPLAVPRPLRAAVARVAASAIQTGLDLGRGSSRPQYRTEQVYSFGAEWDHWIEERTWVAGAHCVRDSAYLNFIHFDRPDGSSHCFVIRDGTAMAGMFALRTGKDREEALLQDLFTTCDRMALRRALALATREARSLGCTRLRMTATGYPALTAALRAEGFIRRSDPDSPLFLVATQADDPQRETLLHPDAWYFLQGDLDPIT